MALRSNKDVRFGDARVFALLSSRSYKVLCSVVAPIPRGPGSGSELGVRTIACAG